MVCARVSDAGQLPGGIATPRHDNKQGGLAAQQADAVAEAIAASACAQIEAQPFRTVLLGTLPVHHIHRDPASREAHTQRATN